MTYPHDHQARSRRRIHRQSRRDVKLGSRSEAARESERASPEHRDVLVAFVKKQVVAQRRREHRRATAQPVVAALRIKEDTGARGQLDGADDDATPSWSLVRTARSLEGTVGTELGEEKTVWEIQDEAGEEDDDSEDTEGYWDLSARLR